VVSRFQILQLQLGSTCTAYTEAQKEAFYFSMAGLMAYGLLGHDVHSASAAVSTAAGIDPFFNFNPVCPASVGLYKLNSDDP
jgi:hypothetical protein